MSRNACIGKRQRCLHGSRVFSEVSKTRRPVPGESQRRGAQARQHPHPASGPGQALSRERERSDARRKPGILYSRSRVM